MKNKNIISLIVSAAIIMTMLVPALAFAGEAVPTKFQFSDTAISVTEGDFSGYKKEKNSNGDKTVLTINAPGVYEISGSCTNGAINVKKGVTGVSIILNGLALSNQGGETKATAPLLIKRSSEVELIVKDGTVNTLRDCEYNNNDLYPDNENAENAVIKCKDGSVLNISGTGTLNIEPKAKNGIKSGYLDEENTNIPSKPAVLCLKDATINIKDAVNDGINAGNKLDILSGTLNITVSDDAIHSDYDLNIGEVGTSGPSINIDKCFEGIEAFYINIYSGNIDITADNDCINASNSDYGKGYPYEMNIFGGNITAYSENGDGLDCNGTLSIYGGCVDVWTKNTSLENPLDANKGVTIYGGTVFAGGGSTGTPSEIIYQIPYIMDGHFVRSINIDDEEDFRILLEDVGYSIGNEVFGVGPKSLARINKGSLIEIKDSKGNVIYSTVARCDIGYLCLASETLDRDGAYKIFVDGVWSNLATTETEMANIEDNLTHLMTRVQDVMIYSWDSLMNWEFDFSSFSGFITSALSWADDVYGYVSSFVPPTRH